MQNTHLRTYVKKHPDNKMAWYLLGKEYLNEGQEAKANYCFQQAGEVYEAFERSKAPADIWVDYQNKLVEMGEQKEKKQRVRKLWLTLLMLLVLALVPPADAPGFSRDTAKALTDALAATEDQEEQADQTSLVEPESNDSSVFTAGAFGGGSQGEAALAAAWAGAGSNVQTSAVLGMQVSDQWSLWKRKMPVKYIIQTNNKGRLTAQSYDAKQCDCEPPEVSVEVKQLAAAWTAKQEVAVSLSSAIGAYRKKNGAWPKNVSELAQPFPNNVIGETSPGMSEMFPVLLAMHQQGKATNAQAGSAAGENAADSADVFGDTLGGEPFLNEPLEIVVDKKNHRLALISGNTIIRNYEVGLGGDRTPEGKFVISDKVVNPNGRSNGEFGSRGMQLSDTNYAIHGTNEPDSIGLDESLGCVRMNKADVEELFALAPQGTPVRIGKDLLPDTTVVPEAKDRYKYTLVPKQNNPNKTYHWLN
ncbi:L,D-transpeptidase [Paenibacillus sp. MER 99-2]|uniref:L,D-transpeptidase family protein n=1 Tax=Paenibacillus sp. MER 99-2 TaxID=2939572 RepID=UPI00203C3940|nr:L,D-transpeptidase [Paenibacillus sp. MER 99-2]MCM3173428.1 L,D-transpeptidase [Paenibacillus sp. MER 99-2]